LLLAFGLASLAAVALGAWICAASGVASASWVRNLIAWGAGALLAGGLAFAGGRPLSMIMTLLAAPAGLAATFLNPDQLGVHRWIDAGPLHVNVAMLLLPPAIVALAGLARERLWPWLAAVVCLALLIFQPDASQALALAASAAVIAAMMVRGLPVRLALFAVLAGLAPLAWFRPDPLPPVAEVEGLVGLAFRISPLAGAGVLLLLAAVVAVPVLFVRSTETSVRAASLGLAACLLLWAVAPFLGAFPVPLAGIGMSPIVGAWLGVGLLAGLSAARPAGRSG
jgi:hypothetical protein